MSAAISTARGKPVRALLLLLGGWVVVRALLWPSASLLDGMPQLLAQPLARNAPAPAAQARPPAGRESSAPAWLSAPLRILPEAPIPRVQMGWQAMDLGDAVTPQPVPMRLVVGHTMLFAAGLSSMELDPALVPFVTGAGPRELQRAPAPAFAPAAAERFAEETAAPRRWSMDAWALWREDDNSPLLSGRPTYGRSQVGAVVRFALAPSSGHAPQAYLRASAALAGTREQEGALGISARPLPFLPVRIAAEGRLREGAGSTEARGAVFAVSEFPPLPLPGETSGEAYVQGGYVTGRNATGFVDGQARITRDLAAGEHFRLSAGGGAWGGAQDGAGRLDIGPSASVTVSAGGFNARLAADYRFRVAGTAQPASGPAVTISAGF